MPPDRSISTTARNSHESSALTAAPRTRNGSPNPISVRVGLASRLCFPRHNRVLSHQLAHGHCLRSRSGSTYVGTVATSVRLLNKVGRRSDDEHRVRRDRKVDLHLGWTYYFSPEWRMPLPGTLANIDYVESVARGSTDFAKVRCICGGSGYSPSYRIYRCVERPQRLWRRRSMAAQVSAADRYPRRSAAAAGYFWFEKSVGRARRLFIASIICIWNLASDPGVKKHRFATCAITAQTNLSRSRCFVLTGETCSGGFGGQVISGAANPLGRVLPGAVATFVARLGRIQQTGSLPPIRTRRA